MVTAKKTFKAEIIVTLQNKGKNAIVSDEDLFLAQLEVEQWLNGLHGLELGKDRTAYVRVHMKGEVNGDNQD